MITIKFNIKSDNSEYILQKQKEYSYAFRKLYKNYTLKNDDNFEKMLKSKFNLSAYEYNCLKMDVDVKIKQIRTQKSKIESDIVSIEKEIISLKKKPKSTKTIRILFKLKRKLERKNKLLSKDIVFGSKLLLKKYTFSKEIKYLNDYKNNRILPINYVGSLNDPNSNRYFSFDFINDAITYKPYKGLKIDINYKISKKYKKYLLKLNDIKNSKLLPISVKLDRNYICLTFDEEILNEYSFNYKEFYKEIENKSKEERKIIYKKYIEEQNKRKLKNKKSNRYASVDLNPEYIGVSIVDKLKNNKLKIVDKFCYQLTELIEKNNKSSDDKHSIYINNKRKYEIGKLYSDLFKILKHYKCAYFVIEELNFKPDNINDNSFEFNRKTKNVWNLDYQKNLINKHCSENGIIKIEINPVYSSFIGNLMYNYFDPVNASIEICRRGIFKYTKGSSIFPEITSTILDTMSKRFDSLRDVLTIKDCISWKYVYAIFKESGIRYRWQLDSMNYNCSSKDNIKSKINYLTF